MIRSSIFSPCTSGFSGLGSVFSRSFGCVHLMCRFLSLRCLLCVAFAVFALSSFALQRVTIAVFRQWDTNEILWGGDGLAAWEELELERRGIWLYSYVLQTSGQLYGLDIDIADDDTLKNVCDRLATNPPKDFRYVNWGGDWSGHLTPYYPTGHVFTDGAGNPKSVMLNDGGELSDVPVSPDGEGGYRSPPIVYRGVTGTLQVSAGNADIGQAWYGTFTPSWGGGIQNTSPATQSTSSYSPASSFVSVGGAGSGGGSVGGGDSGGSGGDSGGSGSGGSASSGSSPFRYVAPELSVVDSGGQTFSNVVTVQRYTVTDTSGNSYPVFDYSGILSSIGGVLQSHSAQSHDDLSTINGNFQKLFEIDDGGELQVAPTDDTEYTVDTSEATAALETVSGWGFSFGLGSNPIGEVFTSILGNPPTSFGSVDQVWDVDFDLGFSTIHSSFSLTSWFSSAFRSCLLMIVTIAFAIAIAKAVSGAFS